MTSYNLFSGFGVTAPGPLNLSPSRVGYAGMGSWRVRDTSRGRSSIGIIASAPLDFHPACTTTKQPCGPPEMERPKQLRAGFFGFLFLALGLPAMKYGAAPSKPKGMGGGGACDSGFCFLSGLSRDKSKSMYYVYFMKGQRGNIKIGVSQDPQRRLKDLQTGHSCKLKLIETFPFESRMQAYETERKLHRRYHRHKVMGEWFKYDMYLEFKGRLAKSRDAQKIAKKHARSSADTEGLRWAREFL